MVKDHGIESTWYAWFDDNLDDYYTVDISESSKTIDPSQLINTLLDNQVTLWHHPDFAPWLVALAEEHFYQWPISSGTELPNAERLQSPILQQRLANILQSLPPGFAKNYFVQELVLMYWGVNHAVVEKVSQTPVAQIFSQARRQRHETLYAKRSAFYKKYGMTAEDYALRKLGLSNNSTSLEEGEQCPPY